MSMREDTTWMKEDLRIVHEVMENLADHVCTLSKPREEPDGVREPRSLEVSAWGTWKDEAHKNANDNGGTTTNTEEAPVRLRDEEPSHVRGGQEAACSIRETQMPDMYPGMHANMTSSIDDGGGGRLVRQQGDITRNLLPCR